MTEKRVSVVIPTYNSTKTIESAIESVLAQSVPVEIIVVDDCSTDDTEKKLAKYKKEGLVRVIRNETNMGVAMSRNIGVENATCPYVAFLDSDDMWRSDKLEKQLKLIEQSGAVVCSTARELINEDGSSTGRVIDVPELISYKMLLKGNVINCSSVVALKEVLRKYPMGNDDIHEDYICWLSILREYRTAVGVNEPLLLYRQVRGSKSGSKLSSAKKTFAVYRKMGFGFIKSCVYFVCYAVNGVVKYFM